MMEQACTAHQHTARHGTARQADWCGRTRVDVCLAVAAARKKGVVQVIAAGTLLKPVPVADHLVLSTVVGALLTHSSSTPFR